MILGEIREIRRENREAFRDVQERADATDERVTGLRVDFAALKARTRLTSLLAGALSGSGGAAFFKHFIGK